MEKEEIRKGKFRFQFISIKLQTIAVQMHTGGECDSGEVRM